MKEKEMELKLRKKHPRKAFRLGRHVVLVGFKKFSLNEAELKELSNKGCKHWVMSKEEKKEKKESKK